MEIEDSAGPVYPIFDPEDHPLLSSEDKDESNPRGNLGTFTGVFVPVSLSMISALLFLRLGFVVGNAGFLLTILLFLIAYTILFFTVTSVCAISTNGAVQGGGVYFMISRTLGPEFGGSIGVLYSVANVFSSALYISGCVEGIIYNFGESGALVSNGLPEGHWWSFLYASCVNIINLVVCLIGAKMFARSSLLLFITISICICSVFLSIFVENKVINVTLPSGNETANYTGLNYYTLNDNIWPNFGKDYTVEGRQLNFAIVFGVLFSSVTGILAGANMSGDLKDPSASIPKGTLSAVTFTFVIYIFMSLLISSSCTNRLLQNDYLFLMSINIWPGFVAIGIITATFSSSLGNLIGASRIIEAVAKDNIFGILLEPINKSTTRAGNPVGAVLLSGILVEGILLIGSLNLIAQITSVFFLLSYMATNLACFSIELTSAPNFRPHFKYFSWHTALIGLVGTCIMMFVISPLYAAISILVCVLIFIAIHLRSPSSNWGSISQALIFHQVRKYLLLLDPRKEHVKFWRPQMLLLVSNFENTHGIITFVNDLKKSGLYVIAHVKVGDLEVEEHDPATTDYLDYLSLVDDLKVKAFIEVTLARSVRSGLQHLVRLSGIGAMKPNTIIFGFPERSGQSSQGSLPSLEFVKMIVDVLKMEKNVCVCRNFHLFNKESFLKSKGKQYVDIWPLNCFESPKHLKQDTASVFILQLGCILGMVPTWKKKTSLRVLLLTSSGNRGSAQENSMRKLLRTLRIEAKLVTINHEIFPLNGSPRMFHKNSLETVKRLNEVIVNNSGNTAISFLNLPEPRPSVQDEEAAKSYIRMLDYLSMSLPPTVYVHGVHAVVSTSL